MNITETLAQANLTIEDITRIYHGKDHECRCGCKGRYFEKGTAGFKRALRTIQSDKFSPLKKGDRMMHSQRHCWVETEGVEVDDCFINIPYDAEHDKCYTLYFD